jgi:predicted nucleic acid-binding Zn ribbon protein
MSRPQKLGDLIGKLMKDSGLEERVRRGRVFSEWERWVGSNVAKNAKPEKLEKEILWVKVSNEAWRQELYYQKRHLIEKLNTLADSKIIKDVKFI